MSSTDELTRPDLDAEYRQLREECGLVDRSARGMLRLTGPDAAEFLHSQVTNEIEGLAPGSGAYAALLDRKGHIQADMRVSRLSEDEILLDTEPAALPGLLSHLSMYKVGRRVEVEDATGEKALLSLVGPATESVAGLVPTEEGDVEEAEISGVEVLAVSTAGGLDLIAAADDAGRLRSALLAAGAVEVSEAAAEILRIEAGVPRFGAELSPSFMPAEAGIVERAVSFEKGCYIGQEPVARLHYKGRPNRHLRALAFSGRAEPGQPLRLGEREVGTVGSFAISPASGLIGLAIVRKEAEPGSVLEVGEPGSGVTAEVREIPAESAG